MMAGSPSRWSMDTTTNLIRSSAAASDHHHQEVASNFLISQTHPNNDYNNNSFLPVEYLHGSSSPSSCSGLAQEHHHAQDFSHSWSQLLLGGLGNNHQEEEIFGPSLFQSTRVMSSTSSVVDHVKQEVNSQNNNNNSLYGYNHHNYNHHHDHHHHDHDDEQERRTTGGIAWSHSHTTMPTSSPKSCVTTLSSPNNILDFSATKRSLHDDTHLHVENSNSECNSTATGGVPTKKPRVQSSSYPPLKVRKEKLGDRITALHQLVSPFGKTDTASVLLEAIGYIRFLQHQIEALSSPYLGSNNGSAKHLQSEKQDVARDFKSRGLCLVPISCTQLVGSDNGADYWAASLGGGF